MTYGAATPSEYSSLIATRPPSSDASNGSRLAPSTGSGSPVQALPEASSTRVGSTSIRLQFDCTRRPRGIPGPAMMRGMWDDAS